MKLKHISLVAIVAIGLSGCVAQWEKVSSKNKTVSQSGMMLELPDNWVVINPNKKLHIVSHDGPSLNSITIEKIELADMSKKLNVPVSQSMDMLEASKKFLSYWSKSTGVSEFDVVTEDYVETQGKGQFYIEWTFKDPEGATIRTISQGTIIGNALINVGYTAPNIHYFDKHSDAFKSILSSIRYNG